MQRPRTVEAAPERFGTIDYLFNNAGYLYLATLEQMEMGMTQDSQWGRPAGGPQPRFRRRYGAAQDIFAAILQDEVVFFPGRWMVRDAREPGVTGLGTRSMIQASSKTKGKTREGGRITACLSLSKCHSGQKSLTWRATDRLTVGEKGL